MTRALTPVASSPTDPRFTTVISSSGFSAGDYVYQRPDGTYGVPVPGAVVSALFDVQEILPQVQSDVSQVTSIATTLNGASRGGMAAKLSNNNIVVVYVDRTSSRGVFAILNSSGTVVVGPTDVSTTILPNSSLIHVTALTNGGFVVHFFNTTDYKPTFGVYTNTGTVTLALAIDTGATSCVNTTSNQQRLFGCTLPNGGFAFSYAASNNTVVTRAYDSGGTPAYAWTSVGAINASNSQPCSIAARSDSTTCVIFCTSTSNTLQATRLSTSGAISNHQFVISNAPTYPTFDICCLTNDTYVIAYYDTSGAITPSFRTLPTSNTLSAATTVPTTGVMTGTTYYPSCYVVSLSNGGFIYFFGDASSVTYYVPYNSAGVALNIGTNVYPLYEFVTAGITFRPGFVERTGATNYLDIYFANGLDPVGLGSANASQYTAFKTTLDLTTYKVYSANFANPLIGTTSQPVSAYGRPTSLPTNAAFAAAATGTVGANIPAGAVIYTPVEIDSAFSLASNGNLVSATLSNGSIVVVYKSSAGTGSAVRAVLYNSSMVLVRAITVATWDSTTAGTVSVTVLGNDKIVIGDGRTATFGINIYIYDSTLSTLLNTITGFGPTPSGATQHGLAAISGNRFVVAYVATGNNAAYQVRSETGTSLVGATTLGSITANSTNKVDCAGSVTAGNFVTKYYNSAGSTDVFFTLIETATNSFSPQQRNIGSTTGNLIGGKFVVASTANSFAVAGASTTGNLGYVTLCPNVNDNLSLNTTLTVESATNITGKCSLGVTGNGLFVIVNCLGSTAGVQTTVTGIRAGGTIVSTIASINDYAGTPSTMVTPWFGSMVALAYCSTNSKIKLGIINVAPYSAPKDLVAGVTSSRPTLNLNPSSSSGYTLIGVAATDCTAGGAGQVQVNGVAALNSQYSASTAYQGFDFQVPGNLGVRGTVAGSTVTLIGDA